MGKITSYPNATTFDSGSDVILKDGTNGTKKMTIDNLAIQNVEYFCGKYTHRWSGRYIYRDVNLGTSFTSEQNAALGGDYPTFKGIYIGAHWQINGHWYTVADIDYWFNKYDGSLSGTESENVHHIVLIATFSNMSLKMNDTSTTNGGYFGSKLYTEYLNEARQIIEEDWGSHIVTHRECFSNAVTDGVPSACIWTDSRIDLMNEPMVYGHYATSPFPLNGINYDHRTIDRDQLAAFALNPSLVKSYSGWLRDVADKKSFAYANGWGDSYRYEAGYPHDVHPVFAIKAT